MLSKELPKKIFVVREEDGDENFLVAGESFDDIGLERGEYTIVGRYRLEEVQEVTLKVSIKEEDK